MKANVVPIAFKNAGTKLEQLLPGALRPPPHAATFEYVCRCYRQMAVGALLMEGDPAPFYSLLFRSSRAFLYYWQACPPNERVTGKAEPFFDAVACRDEEGARQMTALAAPAPNPAREYEEDFFHVRFFMDRFFGQGTEADLGAMLDAWGNLGGEPPDLRLPVCRAILAVDQEAFDAHLAAAIAERLARFARLKDSDSLPPDDGATFAKVSTEVLAWIEFAERAGLHVDADYLLAPGLARRFDRIAFPAADAWRVLG